MTYPWQYTHACKYKVAFISVVGGVRTASQAHRLEYLVSRWWNCLGRMSMCSLDRGGVSHTQEGVIFGISKYSCHSQSLFLFPSLFLCLVAMDQDGSSQLLLQYHPYLLDSIHPTLRVKDSSLKSQTTNKFIFISCLGYGILSFQQKINLAKFIQ